MSMFKLGLNNEKRYQSIYAKFFTFSLLALSKTCLYRTKHLTRHLTRNMHETLEETKIFRKFSILNK